MMKILSTIITLLFATSATAGELNVSKHDGGSNETVLSGSVSVNGNSSLRKKWYVINDNAAPVELLDIGVETRYRDRRYRFIPEGKYRTRADVTAVRINFVQYDVFGKRMQTLSALNVSDLSKGEEKKFSRYSSWYADENDVQEFLTSIAFVSQVRMKGGSIWSADWHSIVEQINQLGLETETSGLRPEKADEK